MRSRSVSGSGPRDRMVSFVWSPGERLPAGTGGSENYTVGQVRELRRRGVAARVVTVGLGADDGRGGFDGIPFHALATWDEVGDLDDTVVFVSEAPPVATLHPAYQVLHVPPPRSEASQSRVRAATSTRTLIATSRYAADLWAEFLDVDALAVHVVRPFAEPVFAEVERPATVGRRVLYAGRLSPEKGIYTLLSMLHHELVLAGPALQVTVTDAGADKEQGAVIATVVAAHPGVRLVAARRSPAAMAQLMAEHDVVVMPSNSQYWHETFGIVSIEAQHVGCRVVASDDGGLPETACGSLDLIEPDNAEALALGVFAALRRGPVSAATRRGSAARFTVVQSVDELLAVLDAPVAMPPAAVISHLEELVALPCAHPARSSEVPLARDHRVGSVSEAVARPFAATLPVPPMSEDDAAAAGIVEEAVAGARRARSDAAARAQAVVAREAAVAATAIRSRNAATAERMTELASSARELVAGRGASAHPATLAALMTTTVQSAAAAVADDAERAADLVARATAETAQRVARLVDALDASLEDDAARAAQTLRVRLVERGDRVTARPR